MSTLAAVGQSIESLLATPPYDRSPQERQCALLPLLKQELAYASDQNPSFRNYVEHWPIDYRTAGKIADLPFLPVAAFKANPPLSLVPATEVIRTLTSSATSGQIPSHIVLDAATSKRMTRSVIAIIRSFIGPARRPYLVIDTAENITPQSQLGARGAAIQGLRSFATDVFCCLSRNQTSEPSLDLNELLAFAGKWKDADVLVYGFTYIIWTHLVQPLLRQGIVLGMPKVHVLHSGGWKRLEQQSVTKDVFVRDVAAVLGCCTDRVIDYYGMVENVGVVYPDCQQGNKHVPVLAEVIVRDPLTLAPVRAGQQGLVQVCSVLPTSFPGFLLLTDDMADLIDYDGCPCGRRGTYFRFARRVPKAEIRGCGNLETARYSSGQSSQV